MGSWSPGGPSEGDDIWTGDAAAVLVNGLGGNDTLNGGWGNDQLHGGNGNDVIFGNLGADYLLGDAGDDQLFGGAGDDTTTGGNGNDALYGGSGDDYLDGEAGSDVIYGGAGNDTIFDVRGDLAHYAYGADQGIDTIDGGDGVDTLQLTFYMDGPQTLNFTTSGSLDGATWVNIENYILYAGDGNDVITTWTGDDIIDAGDGANTINAGAGNDTISLYDGMAGSVIDGGAGSDTLDINYNRATTPLTMVFTGSSGAYGGATWINIENYSLVGGSAGDTLTTGGGDDTIEGGLGADQINAGGGNDRIVYAFGDGADVIDGGAGTDTLEISSNSAAAVSLIFTSSSGTFQGFSWTNIENFELNGGSGNDTLTAGAGDDVLIGNAGSDILNAGAGNDLIYVNGGDTADAGSGNDTISVSSPSTGNSVDGGAGIDTLILDYGGYSALPLSMVFTGSAGSFAGTTWTNIENYKLTGGSGNDALTSGAGDDILNGGSGDDALDGGAGNDTLIGGGGNDALFGRAGVDTFKFDAPEFGADTIRDFELGVDRIDLSALHVSSLAQIDAYITDTVGGAQISLLFGGVVGTILVSNVSKAQLTASQFIFDSATTGASIDGTTANDYLFGTLGSDTLTGFGGNDVLSGAAGDDILIGGLGADTLDGGSGVDIASYANATAGVTVFMGSNAINSGEAVGDVFISIEGVTGSAFADLLGGDNAANTLTGNDGNDWLLGQGGNDTLIGGNGNDVLNGGAGADAMDGGAGIDVAYYRDATSGITVSITNPVANTGDALGDTYTNVENLWGSDFNDTLTGSAAGGQVYGFAGNDTLTGLANADVFYGGTGADTITTGGGADDLFYLSYNNHVNQFGTPEPYEGGDTITDFTHGVDHITVSRYWFGFGNIAGPAAALTGANADFITSGTTATSARPTFFWNAAAGTLAFDPDGTGADAAVNIATFTNGVALTLSDIWTA